MSVLESEDEIEELGNELVDVAKVTYCWVYLEHLLQQCSSSSCLITFWPCRLRGLMASPWSCGASWAVTKESELLHIVSVKVFFSEMIHGCDVNKHCAWCLSYRELVHLVKHVCETLKAKRLDCILVIPPAVTRWIKVALWTLERWLKSVLTVLILNLSLSWSVAGSRVCLAGRSLSSWRP